MRLHSSWLAVVPLLALAASPAAAQGWASWYAPAACGAPVMGQLGAATVTYTGGYRAVQSATGQDFCGSISQRGGQGNNYFTGAGVYDGGGISAPDNVSFIQMVSATTGTISFSEAVVDPYIAFISVGRRNAPITYAFDAPFSVRSDNVANAAYWGTGTYALGDNAFTGREFSGVVQFTGTFTELTFSTNTSENWHGITVGATAIAIPEPAVFMLSLIGVFALVVVGAHRRRA